MPLTTDARTVKNPEVAFERLNMYTMGVLFMVIGVTVLTEDNFDEVWNRVSFYEKVCGPMLSAPDDRGDWQPAPVLREELNAWIGFRTNATPMTLAKFRNHMWNLHTAGR